MARIQPTPEHVALAFERLRRADWPATFAQLPADGMRAALVRATATRLAIGEARGGIETPPRPSRTTPTPTRRAAPVPRARGAVPPVMLDRKRAAAGEREDD